MSNAVNMTAPSSFSADQNGARNNIPTIILYSK